ncbi:hypothetical protein HDV02_006631 [Globomyces sp. JEL0801]|nr:hypothetical protein HDV02_006631 [Globomyces sp. JEL0801]
MSKTPDRQGSPPSNRSPGVRRKNQKRGLTFTLMVAGASGSGKTTFLNTLCESQVLPHRDIPDAKAAAMEKTVDIVPTTVELDEDGTKIALTIIDTPGFGDNINNEGSFQTILQYIETQYDEILAQESRIKRNPKFQEMDIEFMRRLSPRVNLIPIVSKADSMTQLEMQNFKRRVMDDIAFYEIPIYDFPIDPEEDDEDTIEENQELRSLLPFSVIGAETEVSVGGRSVRCRQYPWGIVEVDNALHCDFSKLRYCILSTHLQDLKEITHDVLYEQFRTERLSSETGADTVLMTDERLKSQEHLVKQQYAERSEQQSP